MNMLTQYLDDSQILFICADGTWIVDQGPGHELPDEQPPFTYVDPDGQEFFPKPPNEKTIGISGEPDRDLGTEVEV